MGSLVFSLLVVGLCLWEKIEEDERLLAQREKKKMREEITGKKALL